MKKIAQSIVRLRKLILTVAVLLLIPSAIGAVATRINYDVLTYLPQELDSMIGEVALEDDFHLASTGMITVEGLPTNELIAMKKDIEAVVKAGVHVIRMPKTETAEEVIEVEREIEKVEREIGCLGRTRIMAAIESTLGIVNAYAIATASPRMMGIALGAEDYSANLKTQRTPGGDELRLARETIVVAARAAGIDALDTVYSNLNDMETFRKEVEFIKTLGFDGKSIINPRQIEVVNDVFAPKEKEIEKSRTILAAIKEAEKKGSGVIAVNGKMVDRPVVLRAQRTIDLAIASGILNEEDLK